MQIRILQGSSRRTGHSDINIIVDVIRAFTVAHYALLKGAKGIGLVGSKEEAFRWKGTDERFLLAGEEQGLAIEGFDLDNSPARLMSFDLSGRFLLQKTTNGVRAALNALDADHIFVTGFANARTTAEYICRQYLHHDPNLNIQIIASHPTGDDDLACAEYIRSLLEGTQEITPAQAAARIMGSQAAEKFRDPDNPDFLLEDLTFCTKELSSGFVMKISGKDTIIPWIERVQVN
ncbi:2-phosphosulfolactate phosphatase [Paenibacillus pinistramenti]|uniref:2-phosphosulfolactate phosphatase n=1 Tax=Paenibacillus pinistramenti TaxID=1768003 RepID=UPI001EF0D9AA|nr:2-phosphosulfolactate phosphatase [Paenibacillus pinistramenti]